jgi:hypothetical protein
MSAYRDDVIKALFARASNHGGESMASRESNMLGLSSPPLVKKASGVDTRFQHILDGLCSKANNVDGLLSTPAAPKQFDKRSQSQRTFKTAKQVVNQNGNKASVFQFDWTGTPKQHCQSEAHGDSLHSSFDDNGTLMTLEELDLMANNLVTTPSGGNEVITRLSPSKGGTMRPESSCDTSTTSDMTEWEFSPPPKQCKPPPTPVADSDKMVEDFKMMAASNPMLAKRIAKAANNILLEETGVVVKDIVLSGSLFESHTKSRTRSERTLKLANSRTPGERSGEQANDEESRSKSRRRGRTSEPTSSEVRSRTKSPSLRLRVQSTEPTSNEPSIRSKSRTRSERTLKPSVQTTEPTSNEPSIRSKSRTRSERTLMPSVQATEPTSNEPSIRSKSRTRSERTLKPSVQTTEPTSNEPSIRSKSRSRSERTLKLMSDEPKSRSKSRTRRGERPSEPSDDNTTMSPNIRLRGRIDEPTSDRRTVRTRCECECIPEETSDELRIRTKSRTRRDRECAPEPIAAEARTKSLARRREGANESEVVDITSTPTTKASRQRCPATTSTSTLRQNGLTSSEVATPQTKRRAKAILTEEEPSRSHRQLEKRKLGEEESKPQSKDPPGMKL